MDNYLSALELVTQECWMASLDLKDAYYKYPNDLFSCPRKFTKLLKPVLCVLRTKGHIIIIFIDNLLLIATSYEKCCAIQF